MATLDEIIVAGQSGHISDHQFLAALNNLVNAKGDLPSGTAADTWGKVSALGVNGNVLTEDTSTATGWKSAPQSGTTAWSTWVPTWTNLTVGAATVVYRYIQDGKIVHFSVDLTFAANTSITAPSPRFTLPVPEFTGRRVCSAIFNDSGTRVFLGAAWVGVTAGAATLYDGTAGSNGAVAATSPFTWTTNDRITVSGTYEAA